MARLRLESVRALVENHTPDEAIAGEIVSRGLESSPDDDWVADLRNHGAGARTVAVLSALVPVGTLTINTTVSDAHVSLDGVLAGNSGTSSKLVIPNVRYGRHRVFVRKDRYLDSAVEVTIASKETSALLSPLSAVGLLSVSADPARATLTVDGSGVNISDARPAELPAGMYTVSASAPGYVGQSRQFSVYAGRTTSGTIQLLPNIPVLTQMMISDLEAKNFAEVEKLAKTIVLYRPDSTAYSGLAAVAFALGNSAELLSNARRATEHGVFGLPFSLYHVHDRKTKHEVRITINANSLNIESIGFGCNLPERNYLPKMLRSTKPLKLKDGRNAVEVDLTVPGHGHSKAQFVGASDGSAALGEAGQLEVLRVLLEAGKAGQLSPKTAPLSAGAVRIPSSAVAWHKHSIGACQGQFNFEGDILSFVSSAHRYRFARRPGVGVPVINSISPDGPSAGLGNLRYNTLVDQTGITWHFLIGGTEPAKMQAILSTWLNGSNN